MGAGCRWGGIGFVGSLRGLYNNQTQNMQFLYLKYTFCVFYTLQSLQIDHKQRKASNQQQSFTKLNIYHSCIMCRMQNVPMFQAFQSNVIYALYQTFNPRGGKSTHFFQFHGKKCGLGNPASNTSCMSQIELIICGESKTDRLCWRICCSADWHILFYKMCKWSPKRKWTVSAHSLEI